MIRALYQAVCDSCGSVCDDGEYIMWTDQTSANEVALASDWVGIAAVLPDGSRADLLFCDECDYQLAWCTACEADMDDDRWELLCGDIFQHCPDCGLAVQIKLKETK